MFFTKNIAVILVPFHFAVSRNPNPNPIPNLTITQTLEMECGEMEFGELKFDELKGHRYFHRVTCKCLYFCIQIQSARGFEHA